MSITSEVAYEAVIGIECHVELKTATKMFCGCPNEFGGDPNTKVCPVCLGMPGALPVPNRAAIDHIIRAGLALQAEIPEFSKFDRKNYFYPDMPKDYQISQFDMPFTQGGVVRYWLADGTERSCRLTRIHLEEDTGKSSHAGSADGRIAGSAYSLVDFNRAGVPLMECVSEPDIRSADEAVGFLEALRRTFLELGVSDVKMEEGSLRCDANVSIRPVGSPTLGTKAEIKNMNSFRSVHRAIQNEIARQIEIVASGGRVIQETRGWDEHSGTTHSMRSKEQAHDYRYFPDPDLVPFELARDAIEKAKSTLGEAPVDRFKRYHLAAELTPAQAGQLIDNPRLGKYFEEVTALSNNPAQAANFVLGDLSRLANETGTPVIESGMTAEHLADLIALVGANTITSKTAKEIVARVWVSSESPKAIVEKEGLAQVSESSVIEGFVEEVIAANAKSVADFKAGKENVLQFLKGQVMKASKGKANPALVEELLRKKLQ